MRRQYWIDEIVAVAKELDGEFTYSELYRRVRLRNNMDFSQEWKAVIRRTVENHCPTCSGFVGPDLFEHTGRGRYRLRAHIYRSASEPMSSSSSELKIDRRIVTTDSCAKEGTPLQSRKVQLGKMRDERRVGQSKPLSQFIWQCHSSIFTREERKYIEEAGDALNMFVAGENSKSDFHLLLQKIVGGDVEAVNPAQLAWEKYIVRCDAEKSRRVTVDEGFAGSSADSRSGKWRTQR